MNGINDGSSKLSNEARGGEAARARSGQPPTWDKWREAFRVIVYRPYLRRTIRIAFVVGSVLFIINHLDEVIMGRATLITWVKGVVTYFVPFCVSNSGVLSATHRHPERRA